jgi:HAE1 family hydrophobic/amphiphilic exporter-1
MRIWINPEKWLLWYCSKRYSAALQEQNVEAAQKIWRKCRRCFLNIKYKGRLSEIKDYENIIIKLLKRKFLKN